MPFYLLENIGSRTDSCIRANVLNCLSDYPADWASIGAYLVGPELVEKIKQDCHICPVMNLHIWWRNGREKLPLLNFHGRNFNMLS